MSSRLVTGLLWITGVATTAYLVSADRWFWAAAFATWTIPLTPVFVRKATT